MIVARMAASYKATVGRMAASYTSGQVRLNVQEEFPQRDGRSLAQTPQSSFSSAKVSSR